MFLCSTYCDCADRNDGARIHVAVLEDEEHRVLRVRELNAASESSAEGSADRSYVDEEILRFHMYEEQRIAAEQAEQDEEQWRLRVTKEWSDRIARLQAARQEELGEGVSKAVVPRQRRLQERQEDDTDGRQSPELSPERSSDMPLTKPSMDPERQVSLVTLLNQQRLSGLATAKRTPFSITYPLHCAAELGDEAALAGLVKKCIDPSQASIGRKTAPEGHACFYSPDARRSPC